MSGMLRGLMVLIGLLAGSAADAGCAVASDAQAHARTLNLAYQGNIALIASMALTPKLMHLDYKAAREHPTCDLGPLVEAGAAYELWGGDAHGGERKALPTAAGGPIAIVFPVADVQKLIASAGTGTSAPTEGYLLAVVTPEGLTGWRFYTGMPGDVLVKHDMADALHGRGTPIFRSDRQGQVTMFS